MADQDLIELETLFRTSSVGLCLVDRDLRYVRINDRLAAINGKPAGEHIGRTIHEIIPEIASQIEPIYRQVFESGEPILDMEITGTLPNEPEVQGSWRCCYYPIKSPDGIVERVSVVVEDITALKRARQLLEDRLQFETLLFDLSATFINLPDSALVPEITRELARITETLNIDRVSILEFSEDKTRLMIAHIYENPDAPPFPSLVASNLSSWFFEKIRLGEMVILSRCPDDLPEEAIHERRYCLQRGIKSHLTFPLTVRGSILGAMAFGSYRRYVTWSEDLIQRLRIAAEVFANALARKRAEETLKAERQRLFTLLNELPAFVSIKAPDYSIRYANRFCRETFGNPQCKRCYELAGREGPCDECLQTRVLETGEPQNFEWTRIETGQTFQIYHYPFAEIDGSPQVLSLGFDITGRKQAEEKLREQEQEYRLLVRAIPAVVFRGYADWSIDFFDNEVETLTGYPKEEFASRRLKWCDLILEEDLGGDYKQAFIKAMKGDGRFIRQYRIRTRDGRILWIEARGQIFFRPDGQIDHVTGVLYDDSERRATREALLLSESRLAKAQQLAHVAYWQLNPQSGEMIWSEELYHICGVDRGSFVPSREALLGLAHPDDEARLRDSLEQALAGEWPLSEVSRIVRPNGAIRYLHTQAEAVRDEHGRPWRLVGAAQDITERKQAEEAMRQSEARYRGLVENIDLGISLIGSDYRIIMTNAAMGRNFRKPVSEFVGKECFREFEKREAVCSHCPGTRVMATGRPAEVETEGVRDDASRFPMRLSVFPIFGPNGQVDAFIEVVEDITERRLAEEALRASEEALRKSKESYQILAGQLLNAQEVEQRRLARELHDDLTQRLAALAIEAAKLEQQLPSSRGSISGRLKKMKDKLEKVCKDIDAISRRLHPSVLDDLGLADAAHSECASFARRTGIVVNYKSENISRGVSPDIALHIYRIIQEALRNISRHARATEADISLVGNDDAIHLSIKDNGVGFDPLKVKKGRLGLASMKERVYLVHGDFSVQSRPGQGTVIEVLIPLSRRR